MDPLTTQTNARISKEKLLGEK